MIVTHHHARIPHSYALVQSRDADVDEGDLVEEEADDREADDREEAAETESQR